MIAALLEQVLQFLRATLSVDAFLCTIDRMGVKHMTLSRNAMGEGCPIRRTHVKLLVLRQWL